jgi:hypothetical protein
MPPKKTASAHATTPAKKRAPSAFILFCKKMRPQVVAKHPKMGFGDIGKELGKMWHKLSDAEKAAYKA